MQNHYFKICLPVITLLFFPLWIYAQSADQSLPLADSLFNLRKYTQSLDIYREILEKDRKASNEMILKMAYIEEAVNNYTEALYYLNIYYYMTFNKRALKKMEELAGKNNLEGYKISDLDFFRNILYRYYLYIISGLALLSWLIFSYMVHKKRKYHSRPSFSAFSVFIVLILMIILVNFNRLNNLGLLIGNNNYLMKGPSPGSNLIEIVKSGHRVKILGHQGIWLKIQWKDSIVYIRDKDVRLIKI